MSDRVRQIMFDIAGLAHQISELSAACETLLLKDCIADTEPIIIPRALTPRELQILQHIANGLPNKQIAAVLFLSEKTVKNHISRIFYKLKVSNRSLATSIGIKAGLVNIDAVKAGA